MNLDEAKEIAVGYLDAASYTVSYQTKTIWSGILSMVLLNRTLAPRAGSLSPGGWGCARPETPGFVVAVLQRRRCDAQTTADEELLAGGRSTAVAMVLLSCRLAC